MGQSAAAANRRSFVMPLIAETLIALVIAYLIGIGLAWVLFGRPKNDTYL